VTDAPRHSRQRSVSPWAWGLAAGLALLAAACGGAGGGADGLSGRISIDGSSTVFPITQAAAEEFMGEHSGVQVTVGISGTGGGFQKFCNGETDISNASRPIKESEMQACQQRGIQFIELPVAFDALTVVVNPRNNFVDCMTVEELKRNWEQAAQRVITRWH